MGIKRLKFRGWFPDDERWVIAPVDLSREAFFSMVKQERIDPDTVGQWTGKKSRDDKDLYGGHRIEAYARELSDYGFIDNKEGLNVRGTIFYDEDRAMWMVRMDNNALEGFGGYILDLKDCREIDIIHDTAQQGVKDE